VRPINHSKKCGPFVLNEEKKAFQSKEAKFNPEISN
jgi:hypothetical protein